MQILASKNAIIEVSNSIYGFKSSCGTAEERINDWKGHPQKIKYPDRSRKQKG